MKTFTTLIKAVNQKTGELQYFAGQNVQAETIEDAQEYCNKNGLGYCKVDGEFISETESGNLRILNE